MDTSPTIEHPPKLTKAEAVAWAGSMAELARRLNVTQSAVSQWEEIPELRLWQLAQMGCKPSEAA